MKSNYEMEKLAKWHYDKYKCPESSELLCIDTLDISNYQKEIDEILSDPYGAGGLKRVHIGDTVIGNINDKNINTRSRKMQEVGYTIHDHFIEFNNGIFNDIGVSLKNKYDLSYEYHCSIVIKPGQCMPAHGDTYGYLKKYMARDYPDVKYTIENNVKRYLVFLTDWEWGQCFGAGNKIVGQWTPGCVFVWTPQLLHWCSNASYDPILFFEITGLKI